MVRIQSPRPFLNPTTYADSLHAKNSRAGVKCLPRRAPGVGTHLGLRVRAGRAGPAETHALFVAQARFRNSSARNDHAIVPLRLTYTPGASSAADEFLPSTVAANLLVDIAPETATIGTPVALSAQPNKLTFSSSEQTLYITLNNNQNIVRYDMLTGASDTIAIPTASSYYYGTPFASDIAVQPNSKIRWLSDRDVQARFFGPPVFILGLLY